MKKQIYILIFHVLLSGCVNEKTTEYIDENTISDKDKKRKQYSKSFKKFHLFSVVLYLLKMLASIIGIILIYN